jgi:hypothetical protein
LDTGIVGNGFCDICFLPDTGIVFGSFCPAAIRQLFSVSWIIAGNSIEKKHGPRAMLFLVFVPSGTVLTGSF